MMLYIMFKWNHTIVKKNSTYFTKIYIKVEHKVQIKWVDKIRLGNILETGWRKTVRVENVSLINVSLTRNLKSCFTSFTLKRFQKRWQNTNKSSFQKTVEKDKSGKPGYRWKTVKFCELFYEFKLLKSHLFMLHSFQYWAFFLFIRLSGKIVLSEISLVHVMYK